MDQIPKVVVVILNWNGVKHLQQFLPSVMTSEWPNLQVVIGDNASTDESVEYIKQNFPSIRIIQNSENYGFTGGYNKVLKQVVDADYYILLNSDVEVNPGWIKPVIDLMESDPLIAIAAPKIKSYLQKTHFEHAGAAGGFIDSFGYPFCRGRVFYEIEEDRGQYNQSGEVFWASGAAMFIKKKCWDEANGFDERFFAHMEEIDLCWRLKNKGYKVMYCAQSEIYHLGGGTLNTENPFKTYLNFRNNLLLLKNNLTFLRATYVISCRFLMDLMAIFRFLNEGKRRDAWAVSLAHQNFLRHIFKSSAPEVRKMETWEAGAPHKPQIMPYTRVTYNSKLKCMYKGWIVWDFFFKKQRTFNSLDQNKFYK